MWVRDGVAEMPRGPELTPSVGSSSSLLTDLYGSQFGLRTNDDKQNQKAMNGQQGLGLTQSLIPPLNKKHSIQVVE